MPFDSLDGFNFSTSNVSIDFNQSVWRLTPRIREKAKTIAISHGSNGISQSEINIADFFLSQGAEVELFDHFSSLKIEKLNWGYSDEYKDHFNVSLWDFLQSIPEGASQAQIHLGLSIGGYFGLSSPLSFERVFAVYPGVLPLHKDSFFKNQNRVHIFQAELDSWSKLPADLKKELKDSQTSIIKRTHHSFMAHEKDKIARVISFDFENLFVEKDVLENLFFDYESFKSRSSKFAHIDVLLKSDEPARQAVLKHVLNYL